MPRPPAQMQQTRQIGFQFSVCLRRAPGGGTSVFRVLAVNGVEADPADDLVAIWRSKKGERFQNYRARFTILDTGTVSREWIEAVRTGDPLHASAPAAWRKWMEKGVYEPLITEPTIEYRTTEEQQPAAGRDASLVRCIYGYFKDNRTVSSTARPAWPGSWTRTSKSRR